jgi:8-oxo-dGTP pyrophosphatase MutT (NUDIX family)
MPKTSRVEDAADRRADSVSTPLEGLAFAALIQRIVTGLDPVEGGSSAPDGSDHDLNPQLTVGAEGLAPAAVLIPLIRRPEGLSVLLTQRPDHMRRHAGQIAFPGGRCDAGETAVQTALREAHEEVGLDPAGVRVLGLSTPHRTITGYHVTPVVGLLETPPSLTLNAAEVSEAFEVPLAFLMDPANHERRHREQPPGPPRWFYAIPYDGRLIWGATAAMILALYRRLAPDAS